jgi:Ca2+-binding RTX toxin-like protein
LAADFFGDQPRIITANYGFDGYISVPGLQGTGSDAQAAAYQYGVAWQLIDPILGAAPRAYYSAMGDSAFQSAYGFAALPQDTIPVVFSHPVLGDTLNPQDFRILLNTGEIVTPIASSFSPNSEFNERQTVVLSGDWGNRLLPGESGSRYPVSVTVVDDGSPLRLVTSAGLVSAVGLTVESFNPYVAGNGPRILAAKLNAYSDLGEGNPAWLASSTANSGFDLYGEQAMYRLRIYTSAGFSADGIGSILPTDFSKFFQLRAKDDHGSDVVITSSGLDYNISGFGSVRVLGIADTGLFQSSYDISYVEDHDNQYDIILSGDLAAVARLYSIRMPSGEGRSPVYNPGGPGNDPGNNPPVRFTVASSDQTIEITNDFQDSSFVSYIEIDGPVAKDAVSGQPIGTLIGLAVHDSSINHTIYQYVDPTGKRFYASDDFVIEINIVTGDNRNNSNLTGSAGVDQIYGLGGNDRLFGFAGDDLLDGGLGRDRMSGGSGNDVYIVDGRKDLVFEFRNQGIDEIRTTLSSFTLPSNVENLTFTGMGRFTGSGNGLANRIEGGSSDDTLYGQGGDDELYGQAGRDILIGGAGQDWLYGGADADHFVFSSTSVVGRGARGDVIADFERGLDRIDLRAIDANSSARRDQSFSATFVEEFMGIPGQLRIATYAEGLFVSGDVNGDRLADFDLQVVGVTTLTASDFLL